MGMISKAIELARETLRYDTGYTHARKLIIALSAHREDKDNLMKHYKKQDNDDEVVIGEKSEVCAAKANLEFLLVTVPALEAFCLVVI